MNLPSNISPTYHSEVGLHVSIFNMPSELYFYSFYFANVFTFHFLNFTCNFAFNTFLQFCPKMRERKIIIIKIHFIEYRHTCIILYIKYKKLSHFFTFLHTTHLHNLLLHSLYLYLSLTPNLSIWPQNVPYVTLICITLHTHFLNVFISDLFIMNCLFLNCCMRFSFFEYTRFIFIII